MQNVTEIVDGLLPDLGYRLLNEDEQVCSVQAETNADGYGFDVGEVLSAKLKRFGEIEFDAELTLTGDQREAPWCGDQLLVKVSGTVVLDDGKWTIQKHEVKSVDTNFDDN